VLRQQRRSCLRTRLQCMAFPLGYDMGGGYGACGSTGFSVYDTLYIAQHGLAHDVEQTLQHSGHSNKITIRGVDRSKEAIS